MLQSMKSRPAAGRREEGGFTLIELMVVVLIIAILLAIAIPTFLGAQNKAKDRSAQSSLRNTITAAKTLFADNPDYTASTAAAIGGVESGITFVATGAASGGPKTVSVNGFSATVFYAASMSQTGTCFYIRDDVSAGSATAGTQFATATSTDPCAGDGAKATTAPWKSTGW